MKAEHRKELETNVLADRVGRVVQGMKQAPQKRTLIWVVLAVAVIVVVWFFMRKSELARVENSENWVQFQEGKLQALISEGQSNQSKAAAFELQYIYLRQTLRALLAQPQMALKQLDTLEASYREVANNVKDDKVLLPEALYSLALIEETRMLKDDDNWKKALAAYKEVADNHKDTAFGKLAQKRWEVLNDKDKREEVLKVYQDLRIQFVRDNQMPLGMPPLPENHPPIPGIPGGAEAPKAK
jgi:hypothetical protein